MAHAEEVTLDKLLAVVEALDEDKRGKEEAPPTDEELTQAREALVAQLKDATEGDKPDLEAGRAIRAAIDRIDAEAVTRKEAHEAALAEAKALLEGVEGGDGDGDEGEEDKDGEGDKGDGEGDEGEGGDKPPTTPEVKAEAKQDKQPVAASLADAITRSSQRKADRAPAVEPESDVIVSAVGPAQGHGLGQDAGIDDVADLFDRYNGRTKRGSAVLVHMDRMYPAERSLGLSSAENTRIIDAVTQPRAITAAGGICEPLPADFNHPICGDRGRPITSALPSFRADRGGIRFAPSATVGDLAGGITVWTSENDASDSPDPATKACPRVECEDELSAEVDAIVACLTVGNFQARFNPEFWRSRLDLLMVAHDRIAEQTAYATMLAAATTTLVPAGAGDGTMYDVLRVIDLQTSGIRSRNRLIGTQFRTILPSWTRNAIRTHLTRQAPAGSADLIDIGEARMNQFFTSRGVTPIWSPDIELIGAQAGGAALTAYNTPFTVLTFPEGTYLFLDGGTLDLGTQISDSTLNATNDRQAFMETFEQVVFRGCEALATPVAVAEDCLCPTA